VGASLNWRELDCSFTPSARPFCNLFSRVSPASLQTPVFGPSTTKPLHSGTRSAVLSSILSIGLSPELCTFKRHYGSGDTRIEGFCPAVFRVVLESHSLDYLHHWRSRTLDAPKQEAGFESSATWRFSTAAGTRRFCSAASPVEARRATRCHRRSARSPRRSALGA
jgi:hypothetical protein